MNKKNSVLIVCLLFSTVSYSQRLADILKERAGEGAKQATENETTRVADTVVNKAFGTPDKLLNKLFSKKRKNNGGNDGNNQNNNQNGAQRANPVPPAPAPATLQAYSRFDFVPGAKIVAFDDFAQDAVGDFPAKWNTNGSGEVVTLDTKTDHWLNVSKEGFYTPSFITRLPDNFTLEYDMIFVPTDAPKGPNTADFGFELLEAAKGSVFSQSVPGASFSASPYLQNFQVKNYNTKGDAPQIDNSTDVAGLDRQHNFTAHVSVWRQLNRVRVYLNENKVCDLPSILMGMKPNIVRFATPLNNDGSVWVMSNFKLAEGLPDTRNKLLTVGKFSTTGILFDVNSATIKPESYGTLKDIAQVLKDNPNLKVKIIGNTDSDGDAGLNLSLSKQRAEAVKSAFTDQFGIAGARIATSGAGAANPVAPNTTPEGKAQNRRVEFVKQ